MQALFIVSSARLPQQKFHKIVVISHVDNPKPSIVLMNRNTSMPPITSSMQFYNNRHFQKIVLVSHVVLKLYASMPSIALMTRNTSTPPIATLRQFCSSRHLPNIVFISHVLTRLWASTPSITLMVQNTSTPSITVSSQVNSVRHLPQIPRGQKSAPTPSLKLRTPERHLQWERPL